MNNGRCSNCLYEVGQRINDPRSRTDLVRVDAMGDPATILLGEVNHR
jgi:hypothetical protein